MRVVGVHPARDPIACGEGPVRIGSSHEDHIVLAGGAEPGHLEVKSGARGLTLLVRAGCRRVYVNARAIRERCLLRCGDTVTLGTNKLLVTSDTEPPPSTAPDPRALGGAGVVALRILSGPRSGQLLRVDEELRLGAGCRDFYELAYTCRVARVDAGLVFESDSAVPRVNGWRRNRVWLAAGDQIVLGECRLLVEAPGLQRIEPVAAAPVQAPEPPQVVEVEEASTATWWLIASAALVALVIAVLLYFRW